MQLHCIRQPTYNIAMRMCATHGAETANCGPYCTSQYDAPDTAGPDEPVNGGDAPPDDMPPPEVVNAAALDGLFVRDEDDPRPVVDGGTDDDPATPE